MEREIADDDTSSLDMSIGSATLNEMLIELHTKVDLKLDINFCDNPSHIYVLPEILGRSNLSATAPPFIPLPGMSPQYTPTIPPILSASADVFYMPQSPKTSPKYTPTTPTFYHHEDVSYPTSPTVYLPPIPQTPPAAISSPHQYSEHNDSPPAYETNDWCSYTSKKLEDDTNSVQCATHLSNSPDSPINTPSATTHSRP